MQISIIHVSDGFNHHRFYNTPIINIKILLAIEYPTYHYGVQSPEVQSRHNKFYNGVLTGTNGWEIKINNPPSRAGDPISRRIPYKDCFTRCRLEIKLSRRRTCILKYCSIDASSAIHTEKGRWGFVANVSRIVWFIERSTLIFFESVKS